MLYVCTWECACETDPNVVEMLPVALTGVRAPLIKETMLWQVASLPTLVIGPLLPSPSPETHPSLPFLSLVPSSDRSLSEMCQWAGRNAGLCEIMIRMDGDEGKGVARFPTSLWWSGNAVRLRASQHTTGVYFRQPQSEEPVQSLMMWGGDAAALWQFTLSVSQTQDNAVWLYSCIKTCY